ncbi:MAG TPA: MlaD family protein [Solirubrobacterales bacterium]|nr:MlaD family protein [Solirubrobacterales bacterium]
METRPPTVTRILIAAGFALSCFALALFLWIAFGGPLPLKSEGYRFTVPFKEANQLAVQSDVRISGVSVGKVRSIDLGSNGLADATIEMDSQYAPVPDDTRAILRQKTLLGETYVELTPGTRSGPSLPEGGTLPQAQVSQAVQLDEIFRTFNSKTRAAFRVWMQGAAAALHGRGPDLSAAIAELDPFAEQTNHVLRILDSQHLAVRQLIRSGGDVFGALSERQGQLRGVIQNADTVFSTTARRNRDLQEIFQILPTFLRESRTTLDRVDSFAQNTDPLVRQLRPAAKQLSPTLVATGRLAPELQRFFSGLRGTINASHAGFPALRKLLDDDLPPLLARLGTTVDGHDPYLAQLNSIIKVAQKYRHELTSFLGNVAAATNYGQPAAEKNLKSVKILRSTSPLNPESLATFDQRLESNRANPYLKPLAYKKLKHGLQTFANTPCGAGITATLPPAAVVANDPSFNIRTGGDVAAATDLFDRLKQYAFANKTSTNDVPAPPCRKQGNFESIGVFKEFTPYLHVRRQP